MHDKHVGQIVRGFHAVLVEDWTQIFEHIIDAVGEIDVVHQNSFLAIVEARYDAQTVSHVLKALGGVEAFFQETAAHVGRDLFIVLEQRVDVALNDADRGFYLVVQIVENNLLG